MFTFCWPIGVITAILPIKYPLNVWNLGGPKNSTTRFPLIFILGQAGVDFPVLASVPDTGFDCGAQQFPGIYGDTGADCQVKYL